MKLGVEEHVALVLEQVAARKRLEVQKRIDSVLCTAAARTRAAAQDDSAKVAAEKDMVQARADAAMRAGMQRRKCGGVLDAEVAGPAGATLKVGNQVAPDTVPKDAL